MGPDINLSNKNIQIYVDRRTDPPKLKFIDKTLNTLDDYLCAFTLDANLESLIILGNMFFDAYDLLLKKSLDLEKDTNYN